MFSYSSTRFRRRVEIFDCSPLRYFLWFHTISNISYFKTLLSEVSFNTLLLWRMWHSIVLTIYQSVMPRLSSIKWYLANLVLIAYASSEGSGEPAHPRSLARTFAARSYKQLWGTFRQKSRSLAPLNGWVVKTCHDGMLEDTNSLDGAQI